MRGTVAFWYEPKRSSLDTRDVNGVVIPAAKPRAELHINLWRDLSSGTNFLDVGMLLSQLQDLCRFYLFVPATLQFAHIRDLGPILPIGATLKAVFNDVVVKGADTDAGFEIELQGKPIKTVFYIQNGDINLSPVKDGEKVAGTKIVFGEGLCCRLAAARTTETYLRIRIYLVGKAADLFSSDAISGDNFFASTAGRFELTEFRLNERRSYPIEVAIASDGKNFEITTVHYFLIRDLQHRLIVQHAPFRKVRRLERDLWSDYLAEDTSSRRFKLGARLAARLVIYHWRQDHTDPSTMNGFIAFASFTASTARLITYVVIILLLGAAGSAVAAGSAAFLELRHPSFMNIPIDCEKHTSCVAYLNFKVATVLIAIIGIVALVLSLWNAIRRWLNSIVWWFRFVVKTNLTRLKLFLEGSKPSDTS